MVLEVKGLEFLDVGVSDHGLEVLGSVVDAGVGVSSCGFPTLHILVATAPCHSLRKRPDYDSFLPGTLQS